MRLRLIYIYMSKVELYIRRKVYEKSYYTDAK